MFNPNIQWDVRWGLIEVIRSLRWSTHEWISALAKESPERSLVPYSVCGHHGKKLGPHKTPGLPASKTARDTFLFIPPNLWYSVMAA